MEDLVYWFAEVQPRRALEVARKIPEAHEAARSMALRWAAVGLARSDLDAGLAVLREVTGKTDRGWARDQIIIDVSAIDPDSALALLRNKRRWPCAHVLGRLARRDPDRALSELPHIRKMAERAEATCDIAIALLDVADDARALPLLREAVERAGRLRPDEQSHISFILAEAGRLDEVLELLEARDPLDFWPQHHIDTCCLPMFRRLLRHDRARVLSSIGRLTPDASGIPLGLAAMDCWMRSPKRARVFLGRIADDEQRDWALEALVDMLATARPEDAVGLMRERTPPEDDRDRLFLGRDWLRIGTDESVRRGLPVLRAIRRRSSRAHALARAAGDVWTGRQALARRLLAEAARLVGTPRSRRGRDEVRRELVSALTSWPDAVAGEGIAKAETWAAQTESPLMRAECYEDLAVTFIP
jgi:hypothetical protein